MTISSRPKRKKVSKEIEDEKVAENEQLENTFLPTTDDEEYEYFDYEIDDQFSGLELF